MIKRKCDNPKFKVIVCCQGQPFYYQYKTLIGALFGYAKQYLQKNKYGTMNFSLKQILSISERSKNEYNNIQRMG